MKGQAEQEDELQRRIDRVLDGLGSVQPSPAFESRLLRDLAGRPRPAAVESQRSLRATWGSRWARAWQPERLARRTAAVACGVVLLTLLVVTYESFRPKLDGPHAVTGRLSSPGKPSVASPTKTAQVGVGAVPVPLAREVGSSMQQRSRSAAVVAKTTGQQAAAGFVTARLVLSADPDQAAADDLGAPSQPAPPMPLTAQERRVRLMLRRGEKREMAQLDPERRVLSEGQDRAEQRSFFDPPRPQVDPFQGVLPW